MRANVQQNTLNVQINDAQIQEISVNEEGRIIASVELLVNRKPLASIRLTNSSAYKNSPEYLSISAPDEVALAAIVADLYALVKRSAVISIQSFSRALPPVAEEVF